MKNDTLADVDLTRWFAFTPATFFMNQNAFQQTMWLHFTCVIGCQIANCPKWAWAMLNWEAFFFLMTSNVSRRTVSNSDVHFQDGHWSGPLRQTDPPLTSTPLPRATFNDPLGHFPAAPAGRHVCLLSHSIRDWPVNGHSLSGLKLAESLLYWNH